MKFYLYKFFCVFIFCATITACGGGSDSDNKVTSLRIKIQDNSTLIQNNPKLIIKLMDSNFDSTIEEKELNLLAGDSIYFDGIKSGTYGVNIVRFTDKTTLSNGKRVVTISDGENITLLSTWGKYGNYVHIDNVSIRVSTFVYDVIKK